MKRREAQRKLPLVMQKVLTNSRDGKGQPLMDAEFVVNYSHNRREAIMAQKPFQQALAALHDSNPFKEVKFGDGTFTYVPTACAREIEALCAQYDIPLGETTQGKAWSAVRYLTPIDGEPRREYAPPSQDHALFIRYVQIEQHNATEDQHPAMTALLKQMDADIEEANK
jgi:hypothetical protein